MHQPLKGIGFQPPKGEGGALTSPVGGDVWRLAAIPISEGFNLGFYRAKPGNGAMMHDHDTNETFIPMAGTWRFPRGVGRRFENATSGDPDVESI